MATIQDILNYAERYYPKSTLVSTSDKVSDLNDVHTEVYVTIQRLKNDYEIDNSSVTIADNIFYPLPSNCRIDDIIKIEVSEDTSGTEFEEYKYAGLGDDISTGKYFGRATNGLFFLFKDELPISTSGLKIYIYFYPRPTLLSASNLSAIPDLDVDYHDLLKFGLIQSLASQGLDPDTSTADYWQRKYDEKMQKVKESLSERYNTAPTQRSQVRERM